MSIDELTEYGLERMDDGEISDFLTNQGAGVLGLAAHGEPYLVPLSFGYDDESWLYFTYVLGESSEKERFTERTEIARFLVYSAEGAFNWESVLLTGTIERLPEEQLQAHEEAMENAWHPDVLEKAQTSRGIAIYGFHVDEQVGIKHTGLPEGFRTDDDPATHR